jgi:hypothetical protein
MLEELHADQEEPELGINGEEGGIEDKNNVVEDHLMAPHDSGTTEEVEEPVPPVPAPETPKETSVEDESFLQPATEKPDDLDAGFPTRHSSIENNVGLQHEGDTEPSFTKEPDLSENFSKGVGQDFTEDENSRVHETVVEEKDLNVLHESSEVEDAQLPEETGNATVNDIGSNELNDIFGGTMEQDLDWGSFESRAETFNEDPAMENTMDEMADPESQGYERLPDKEEDAQPEPDNPEIGDDPEMGNTSAEVQDAETGYTNDESTSSLEISEGVEPVDNQVAAFSQIQGSGSRGAAALEIVAHQLVDPSNPVPQMEPKQPHEKAPIENVAKDWWDSSGNDDEFAVGRAENEGAFNDDFNPTNGSCIFALLNCRYLKAL